MQSYIAEVTGKGFRQPDGFVAVAADENDVRRQIAEWYPKSWAVKVLSISKPMTKTDCLAELRKQLDAAKARVSAITTGAARGIVRGT